MVLGCGPYGRSHGSRTVKRMLTSHAHSRKSKEGLCSVHFLLCIRSRMPHKGMALPTVGRFAHLNLMKAHLPGHSRSIKLTSEVNNHANLTNRQKLARWLSRKRGLLHTSEDLSLELTWERGEMTIQSCPLTSTFSLLRRKVSGFSCREATFSHGGTCL